MNPPTAPRTWLREEAGYTLAELLVALLVALVLGGVLGSIYQATTRWLEPWRREVALENRSHLIVQRLAADLTYAAQLLDLGEGAWRLTYPGGRAVTYRNHAGTLHRNGLPMHGPGLLIAHVALVPSQAETQFALLRRETLTADARRLVRVEIRLGVKSRERTLALTTTVAMRRHRPWQPVRPQDPSLRGENRR